MLRDYLYKMGFVGWMIILLVGCSQLIPLNDPDTTTPPDLTQTAIPSFAVDLT